jgi:hypothetical protein
MEPSVTRRFRARLSLSREDGSGTVLRNVGSHSTTRRYIASATFQVMVNITAYTFRMHALMLVSRTEVRLQHILPRNAVETVVRGENPWAAVTGTARWKLPLSQHRAPLLPSWLPPCPPVPYRPLFCAFIERNLLLAVKSID